MLVATPLRRLRALPAFFADLRVELVPLARLAGPVAIAEVGWMAMGLVDTMFVGRVSAAAIGAVSVGGALGHTVCMIGLGILLALDHMVSHAFGAGRHAEGHRALIQGLYVSAALSIVLMALLWILTANLQLFGIDATVLPDAIGYTNAITWGVLPLLLFATLRRYLQATDRVRPVTIAAISANLINAGGNWILVFGNLGAPALGATGSAWATVLSRVYMLLFLALFVLAQARREDAGLLSAPRRFDLAIVRRLLRLGLPAAGQTVLEVGAFAAATLLAARIDATSLAAHQIALGAAALSFMVPLGVSSAGAVRVGQALGRGDPAGAERAGASALLIGAGFMTLAATVFLLFPQVIVRAFTSDPEVVATGVYLLRIAAVFQLFDGLQVVATGILRGAGDTRTPLITGLVAFWAIGLPVGALLAFWVGWGVLGLWTGLSVGLICVAVTLVRVWRIRIRTLVEASRRALPAALHA